MCPAGGLRLATENDHSNKYLTRLGVIYECVHVNSVHSYGRSVSTYCTDNSFSLVIDLTNYVSIP